MSKHRYFETLKTISLEAKHRRKSSDEDDKEEDRSFGKDISKSSLSTQLSPEERKVKRRIIIALLFAIALTQSTMLILTAFMPLYVNAHYKEEITTSLIGLIIR